MNFGINLELSVPRPWTADSERRVYQESLEQVRLADQLGFDQVWVVEHHFLEEYSHSSAPDLFLTACAMQTERIRLCQGVVVCVPEINNPIRIAERTAVLDILSGGRVEVATGRSTTWTELGGFGVDPETTKKSWDEFVHVIPKLWTEDRFEYHGEFFSMPERSVLPKPLQKPHPPLWVAVTSPGTELDAAERGLGSHGLSLGGLAAQEQRIANYRKRIQQCDPVGAIVNEQVNCVNFLFCHEDRNYARRRGERLAAAFSSAAAQTFEIREAYPTDGYRTPGLVSSLRRDIGHPGSSPGMPEGLAFGDPDDIVAVLRQWEAIGADRIVFLLNELDAIPHAEILASLRLFAAEVMPHLHPSTVAEVSVP